jgi:hypothetical protein
VKTNQKVTEMSVVDVKTKTIRSRPNLYPLSRISNRTLSADQADLIVRRYIQGKEPAWDVARAIGPEWAQADIYILARKLSADLGIPWNGRKRKAFDWALVSELRNEGMTWREVADYLGTTEKSLVGNRPS